ncbi:MAG: hypothetical protein ACK4PR_11275, partial [Gammaproteobacteria bacterium]
FAVAYKRRNRIVIAVRGTDITNVQNIITDISIALGIEPSMHIKRLDNFLRTLQKTFKNCHFRFTGHSLGAALALSLNVKHNYRGTVFECPGIPVNKTISRETWRNQHTINFISTFVTAFDFTPITKIWLNHDPKIDKEIASLQEQRDKWAKLDISAKVGQLDGQIFLKKHDITSIIQSLEAVYNRLPINNHHKKKRSHTAKKHATFFQQERLDNYTPFVGIDVTERLRIG